MKDIFFEVDDTIVKSRLDEINSGGLLPALGITITSFERGKVLGGLEISPDLRAPNGYLHAGVIVTLADTLCGTGCRLLLPRGASNFTTLELKSNFISTASEGMITGLAHMVHGGRTTQIWDCRISSESTGKIMSEFRCTQLIIYPGAAMAGSSPGIAPLP